MWYRGQGYRRIQRRGQYDPDEDVDGQAHDFDSKSLLKGFVIPARTPSVTNAERDVEDALHSFHRSSEHRTLPQFTTDSVPGHGQSLYLPMSPESLRYSPTMDPETGKSRAVVKTILLTRSATRDGLWVIRATGA